jgi:hypothetical protein
VAFNKKAPAVGRGFAYLKCMKIEFDKAILWLIPYLYLVSVLYYWGYWGTLGVDVFNYYPVTDLIKGITTPLRTSLALALFTGVYFIFLKFLIDKSKKQYTNRMTWLMGFIILTLNPTLDYFNKKTHTDYTRLMYHMELIENCFTFLMVIISYYVNKNLTKMNWVLDHARFSLLCATLILPVQSFCDGRKIALATQFNRNFLYTVTAYVNKRTVVYKYLGKTGDYQVFETLNNHKKIIIPVTELKPFIFEEYSMNDRGTLSRFRANARRADVLNGQVN